MLWSVLLVLTGCRGLAGTWRGELLCLGRQETIDGDAIVDLRSDRGGEYDGELRAEGDYATATGRAELVLAWELELEKTSPSGRQQLDSIIDACLLYVDGSLIDDRCPEPPLSWTWDGGDLIEMQSEGCSLSLSR